MRCFDPSFTEHLLFSIFYHFVYFFGMLPTLKSGSYVCETKQFYKYESYQVDYMQN